MCKSIKYVYWVKKDLFGLVWKVWLYRRHSKRNQVIKITMTITTVLPLRDARSPSLWILTVKRIKINLPLLLPVPISLVLNWCLTLASKRPQMTGMYKITKTREQVCIVSSSADNSRLIIIVKINKKAKKLDKKKKTKNKKKHLTNPYSTY